MKHAKNIEEVCELNPDFMGFIFYPPSPRYVVGTLLPETIKEIPAHIVKTGVFVNADKNEILKLAELYHLDAVQLHGHESPQLCLDLKNEGLKVLKALRPDGDLTSLAHEYTDVCDLLLFDTPSVNHGGTGQKFDWHLLEKYNGELPYLLSGGIGVDDAETLLNLKNIHPHGVDINSKFEIEPGLKDVAVLEEFINIIR
ncbi:phosphoribosylanthranilate isomerase [Natronoflexus pectinivorans]|nr:phosphoribosylanthranilate isomerase [Natronoflexus pectinivorans]